MTTGRITGSAYKNESGDGWFYQISIPANLAPDGRRRREKKRGPRHGVNFATKGEALKAMDKRLAEIKAGKIDFSDGMTLAEFADAWYRETEGEAPDHRRALYLHRLQTYLLPWLGSVKLRDLADRLKAHYRFLQQQGKHQGCCYRIKDRQRFGDPVKCKVGKPLATSTIGHIHAVLTSVLSYTVEKDLFVLHPLHKVKGPGRPRTVYPTWTADDANQAITVFGMERLGTAWIIALMRGLRRGELAGLRWEDIDIEARVINVRNQRTVVHAEGDGCRTSTAVVEKPPKGTSTRTVPMPEIVALMLTEHRKRQRREGLANGYGSAEYVFVDKRGEPYSGQSIYRQFVTACKRHGLPVVRLHDLRHTFATLL